MVFKWDQFLLCLIAKNERKIIEVLAISTIFVRLWLFKSKDCFKKNYFMGFSICIMVCVYDNTLNNLESLHYHFNFLKYVCIVLSYLQFQLFRAFSDSFQVKMIHIVFCHNMPRIKLCFSVSITSYETHIKNLSRGYSEFFFNWRLIYPYP